MIIQIVRHDVKDGMLDIARERIDAMTSQMSRQAGFVFRHAGQETGQDMRITTVTAWLDSESLDRWEEARKALPLSEIPAQNVYSSVKSCQIDTTRP